MFAREHGRKIVLGGISAKLLKLHSWDGLGGRQ